jgi:phosphohistidine phosphatase
MRLYLVRHAHAAAEEEDPERPLNERGRRVAASMAAWLKPSIPADLGAIIHSSLARSRQSAEIFAGELGMGDRLLAADGLLPEDDPTLIVPLLQNRAASLMIVGHEPHLGRLASYLLVGERDRPLLLLKKGAVCCLRFVGASEGAWILEWSIKPKLLRSSEEE